MAEIEKQIRESILGDIKPNPETREPWPGSGDGEEEPYDETYEKRDDANQRAGSRELDEGGGVAAETGGTRNYHSTGGATGGDLGNRPE